MSLESHEYRLPQWFLEHNVKTSFDIKQLDDQIVFCSCKHCGESKVENDPLDPEDDDFDSDDDIDSPEHSGEEEGQDGAPAVNLVPHTLFSKLRNLTAETMLQCDTQPEQAVLLFRANDPSCGCSSHHLEPVIMNNIVTQVAKSMCVSLVSFDLDDLEDLGYEFYNQSRRPKSEENTAPEPDTSVKVQESVADEVMVGKDENPSSNVDSQEEYIQKESCLSKEHASDNEPGPQKYEAAAGNDLNKDCRESEVSQRGHEPQDPTPSDDCSSQEGLPQEGEKATGEEINAAADDTVAGEGDSAVEEGDSAVEKGDSAAADDTVAEEEDGAAKEGGSIKEPTTESAEENNVAEGNNVAEEGTDTAATTTEAAGLEGDDTTRPENESAEGNDVVKEKEDDVESENKADTDKEEASPPKAKKIMEDDWKPKLQETAFTATFSERYFAATEAEDYKWNSDLNESLDRYAAWKEHTTRSYSAIIDAVTRKATQQAADGGVPDRQDDQGSTSQQAERNSSATIIHFIDCDHSSEAIENQPRARRRAKFRIGDLVKERRKSGENVILIVSSSVHWDRTDSFSERFGISELSSINLQLGSSSAESCRLRQLRRKGEINTRRLRRIMSSSSPDLLPAEKVSPVNPWPVPDIRSSLECFGESLWSKDDLLQAVSQLKGRSAGRRWDFPQSKIVLSGRDVRTVLRRLGLLVLPKKEEVNESDSEEECDQNTDPLDGLSLNESEESLKDCVIRSSELKVTWDDVVLPHDTKEILRQLVSRSKLTFLASESLLNIMGINGVLLYGPPGCGKTHIAKVIAGASGSNMIVLDPATMTKKYYGETEILIKGAFSLARKLHPCVIFIDEVDAMFRRRSSSDQHWERSVLAQYLQEMDGISTGKDTPLVFAATNSPWEMDDAFYRRFPQKIHVGLPDIEGRAKILRTFLQDDDVHPDLDIDGIALASQGYSGSDLRSLCAEAALIWKIDNTKLDVLYENVGHKFSNVLPKTRKIQLNVDHFITAFDKIHPGNYEEMVEKLNKFTRQFNPQRQGSEETLGGKRYIYSSSKKRSEIYSVQDLITRQQPQKMGIESTGEIPVQESESGVSYIDMQLVTWQSFDPFLAFCHAATIASSKAALREPQEQETIVIIEEVNKDTKRSTTELSTEITEDHILYEILPDSDPSPVEVSSLDTDSVVSTDPASDSSSTAPSIIGEEDEGEK